MTQEEYTPDPLPFEPFDPPEEEIPEIPVPKEDDGLWETRITVNAKKDVKISQNQTMTESKQYDVADFLSQTQLDHILDCIQPINEI